MGSTGFPVVTADNQKKIGVFQEGCNRVQSENRATTSKIGKRGVQELDEASPVRILPPAPYNPPYTFSPKSNTHTKTTHFQHSNPITQPIQHQKTHIHIPIFISYPISTSPLCSFNNNNQNYIPPQQIPPKTSKLHTNIFHSQDRNPINNFS